VERRADFAPDERRDAEKLFVVDGTRDGEGVAGNAPVVIESEDEIGE